MFSALSVFVLEFAEKNVASQAETVICYC
jgi:hypothetical protein